MPPATWETLIAELQSPKGAVHEPLLVLMILGRALRGGPANVFRFRDLDEPLSAALRAFGPPRKRHHPERAFWRLREHGFWVVHREARLGPRTGPEPSRRRLLDEDAAAEVPRALWDELSGDHARTARLAQRVVEAHWPAEVRGAVLADLVFDLRVDDDEV